MNHYRLATHQLILRPLTVNDVQAEFKGNETFQAKFDQMHVNNSCLTNKNANLFYFLSTI